MYKRQILEDTQTPVILTTADLANNLPTHQAQVVCLDSDWEQIARSSQTNPVSEVKLDNLIYVIYTSGSTGKPKGVMISHRGISNQLYWRQTTFGLTAGDKVLQTISFSFDPSVWQIFWPLCFGAQLVMARPGGQRDMSYLVEAIANEQITVAAFVPSQLRALLEQEGIENCRSLRHVTSGGEALPMELVERFFERLNLDNVLVNCYGPTEASIDTTFWVCQRSRDYTYAPIGRPISNAEIYILDENLQPVAEGECGELYIGGAGLARGYFKRPDLTKQRFIQHPFSSEAGARLYKTGDLARYLPDGNIQFLGRIDEQVKIRGFRVELGEIAAVLNQHSLLKQAIAIVREDIPGDKRLVAYIVANSEQTPTPAELRCFLQQQLPDYMVPSAFVFMDALPLSPNGKIDRHALPVPAPSCLERSTSFVAPRTHTEEVLANVWAEVLGVEVGIHDNFFALGGHSLLAAKVISRVRDILQVDLPMSACFECPTIADLAKSVEAAAPKQQGLQALSIQPVSRQQTLPLSFTQELYWFLTQLHPGEPIYNETCTIRLGAGINIAALEQSLTEFVRRHEILRTTFATANGKTVQVINPPFPVTLPIVDLRQLTEREREAEARQLATAYLTQPFDLGQGPLLRSMLIRLSEADNRLYVAIHHLVMDGVSMHSIFLPELQALYAAFTSNQPSPLPELTLQYADFAVWQRQWLQEEILLTQLAYWQQKLANLPKLQLPTNHPQPTELTFQGSQQSFALSKSLTEKLKILSRQEGTTLFMTLVTAIKTLLYRYSNQEDIAIGTVTAGRNRPEVEGVMGNFLNNLVLRTDLSGNPPFRELLKRVREVTLEAYAHQDLPFQKLVEVLQPERQLGQNPLFQVAFVLEPPLPECHDLGWTISQMDIHSGTAKFHLCIEMDERPEGMIGRIEYRTDLFDAKTITRMIGHLQTLLEGIVANPEQPISQLPLLTAAEQQQLLFEWNNTQTEYPQHKCIHQLFEEQVERTPDAVALVFEDVQTRHVVSLTYRQLNQRANQLAHYLRGLGVGPEVLVGICVERSIEMVVGLLGILKAGGAYVPVDPNYPVERLAFIWEDAGVSVLLTQEKLLSKLPQIPGRVLCIDTNWGVISAESEENVVSGVTSSNLAYVIYTSGSTGKPKGVLIEHKCVVNLLESLHKAVYAEFQNPQLRVSFNGSFSFDTSVKQFIQLLKGHTLYIVPETVRFDGDALLSYLQNHKIHVFDCTPSQLELLIGAGLLRSNIPKCVLVGGEAIAPCTWQALTQAENINFYNVYGPTECTVDATLCKLQISDIKPIIGRPIANTQVYILDSHLQPVPIGVPGELHIGGVGLARGYLNSPDLTAEKFISNPFANPKFHRLYKTGDLARYLSDGNIEYLGRIDHQVKMRGFRIELGEIEASLNQNPAVQQVVVIAREDVPGEKCLVAYATLKEGQNTTANQLRDFLRGKLPNYMIPSAFVILETLPLTPNGKVDRKALPAPTSVKQEDSQTFVAPRNQTEYQLTKIWEEVLGVQPIGIQDNFFDLGGHSFLALKLFAKIEAQFGKKLPLAILFQSGTVEALAQILHPKEELATSQGPTSEHWSSLVAINSNGSKPPLFCVHDLAGEVFYYRNLSLHLGSDQPIYGLQSQGLDGKRPPLTRVEDMASYYIQQIRTVQPQGPYFLAGYCFGGLVAFEMAQQLHKQGEKIGILVLLDAFIPNVTARLPFWQRIPLHFNNVLREGPAYIWQRIQVWYQYLKYKIKHSLLKSHVEENLLPSTPEHLKIIDVNKQAMKEYVVQAYSGQMVLLLTEESKLYFEQAIGLQCGPLFGWGNFITGGLDVNFIPGLHLTCLKEPHVQVLAEKLQTYLDRAFVETRES
ncbi:MAG: amino acid adenylation domain-containing protein [Fischerella sp.]|nr:amino acid adenylation domain-containing protein [Fischerella sp.]